MSESNDTLDHVKSITIDFYTDPTGATQKEEIAVVVVVATFTEVAEDLDLVSAALGAIRVHNIILTTPVNTCVSA